MNRISMYSSSRDLRHGLHRALAMLALDPLTQRDVPWWTRLPLDAKGREAARRAKLGLEELAVVYAGPSVRDALDRALAMLGVTLPPRDALAALFRRAIISGRAHQAHLGRDVYGLSNKALWDAVCAPIAAAVGRRYHEAIGEPPIQREAAVPLPGTRERLETLLAFDTSPEGPEHVACATWLGEQLAALGFSWRLHALGEGAPPVVEAHRPARGMAGHVVLYGHYDVTPLRHSARGWDPLPKTLTEVDGRWFAHGIGDNKGPLAARLTALATALEHTPALTWFIQGEEETGSRAAFRCLRERLPTLRADAWLDETGYHDHEDGTLRLLARTLGPGVDESAPPDAAMGDLLDTLRLLAGRWGIGTRLEVRGLNKALVEGGCPFNRNLPAGARYLALGVNDSRSRIHGTNESVPTWTFPLHAEQLRVVFHWVDRTARGEA